MSKKVLSLVLALVMVLGTLGTAFADTTEAPATKVEKLQDLGLIIGDDSGNLGLENAITRAEMSTVIVRALGLDDVAKASQGFPSQFSDMNSANVLWARGYVNVAVGQGIVKGYPEGTFLPANNVTYAEAIAMLVRAGNGITAEEEAVAVWPTTYLAKAAQLGVLDGTSIADYNAPAIRGTLFDILYNAVINLQMGDYQVVKAIVLENYRVEKLAKDEVVVEIIEEVQRAKFVEESRKDMRGEQLSLTIPAKVADVEALLGRVYNFTLNKAGEVVSVAEDTTFKVEVLTEEDVTDRKFGDYTVELRERRSSDERDDRIFRTYYNNEDFAYEDFVKELTKEFGKDKETIEYAKVTTKNGKVVYIDAFNFDDIAPVKEVRADGATVVAYNDVREGTTKNISLKASDDILFVTEGNVSVGTREDIKALDVIHEYDGGFIVRRDAAVSGTYEKVTSDRTNKYFVVVEGEEYRIGTAASKQAVYVYDEDEFYTLEAKSASESLREFKDEEVTILLDLTEKLQYIGAEIEMGEFVGIVTRVVGDKVRVLKSDNKTYDYVADLDTKVNGSRTGHRALNAIEPGDLVYMSVDGETVKAIKVLTTYVGNAVEDFEVDPVSQSSITLVGDDTYRVFSDTLVFVNLGNDKYEVKTMKQVVDAWKDTDRTDDFRAYVLDGPTADDEFDRPISIKRAKEAHTIVFTDINIPADTKEAIVQFEGWSKNKTEMKIRLDGTDGEVVTRELDDSDKFVTPSNLTGRDVIEIVYNDNDAKEIVSARVLIDWETATEPVFGVKDPSSRNQILLEGRDKSEEYYLARGYVVFGGQLSSARRASVEIVDGDVKAVLVRDRDEAITGYLGSGGQPGSEVKGIVTAVGANDMSIAIDGEVYYADSRTKVMKNNVIVGVGSFAPIALGDKVTVKDNVATIEATKAELDAAELTRVQAKAAARLSQATQVGVMTVANDADLAAAKTAVAKVTAPALTTAELALLDGTTTPTAAAYNSAENDLATTKSNIADYEAAQGVATTELAKVPAELVLDGNTTVNIANIKLAVEDLVDLNKVTVAVAADGTKWEITITSKVGLITAKKSIEVTNEDAIADAAALEIVNAELTKVGDVELPTGTDLSQDQSDSVKAEVEGDVDLNKVTVSVTKVNDNSYTVQLTSKARTTVNNSKNIAVN